MILRPTSQRDWFQIDRESAKPLWGVPGVNPDPKNPKFMRVHRSALAIMDLAPGYGVPQPPITLASKRWAARDEWCAERGFKLRTTQQQAIDFITARRGAVLADDMRLGKTLSALMSHDPARGPLVIIAPLSTRAVWLGWAKRVFPEFADRIGVLMGKTFDKAKLDNPIIFAHYDIIRHWRTGMRIGTLVLDEAHAITKPNAERAKAAQLISLHAEQIIPMTGTPIWKFPPDFWMILNIATPGAWGSWHDFAQRYGAPEPTGHGTVYKGSSNERELHRRLSEVMLRRRWLDVADDLPPITRSVVVADIEQRERDKLDLLAAALHEERTNTAANLAHYRKLVSAVKIKTAIAEAKKVMSRGQRVVVWTWHKDTADEIAAGLDAFLIHGDIAIGLRDERIAAWRESYAGALVATMAVAQAGIDLSQASIAIFAEIDWTPAVIGQAEMRTYDPMRSMDILFIIANHFVDQRIVRALVAKLGAADPFGVAAAIDSIDALRDAVLGPVVEGDLDRLLEDLLASAA